MDKSLINKFIAIVVSLVACTVIISVAAAMAYNFTLMGQQATVSTPNELNSQTSSGDILYKDEEGSTPEAGQSQDQSQSQEQNRSAIPDLNILVLGIDDEANLPDTIFVVAFDGENNEIDIISIPRDTQVVMTEYEKNIIRAANRWFPNHGVVKLNELHAHGGTAAGHRVVTRHIENMLGIEIHNYVILDLDAFRFIVDAVGGVYMDIPHPGLYYNRPGNTININVPPGRQHLDGYLAEQVVRNRQYRTGDLGRIDMTQQFMYEFFVQVLAREHIVNNAGPLVRSFMSHVRTDFGILDALRYIRVVDALNPYSIEFHTVPGHAAFALNPLGVNLSWFFVDREAAGELMAEIKAGNVRQ